MGREAKFQQYSREQFLLHHPACCYCGAPATTTDHCPPRAMFRGRVWPEGYEFPACHSCNQETRRDEQVLAMLGPLWFAKKQTPAESEHWEKHVRGLRNNQPEIVAELLARDSRNAQRHSFRSMFGTAIGDELRRLGYGIANIGPITRDCIQRFSTKLAKALYYRHTSRVLDGQIWAFHFTATNRQIAIPLL